MSGRAPAGRLALAGASCIALASAHACASPGQGPTGGPEDRTPPRLVRIAPESGRADTRPKELVFEFDEVVSETPRTAGGGNGGGGGGTLGGPTLDALVIVSPRDGAPRVGWGRDRLEVRPRRGFRPNTTYTVTLLPGLVDLSDNVRDTAIVTYFSTGPQIDRGRLAGTVFDWVAGRPAARAWVEAMTPDSTRYVAVADSSGRFVIDHVPAGTFLVSGGVDANGNRTLDAREAFDSARVASSTAPPAEGVGIELLAFVHDTVAPRIQTVTVRDSVTLRLTFDKSLAPAYVLRPAGFEVVAPDSSRVPITATLAGPAFDSTEARLQRERADSAARTDTTRRAPGARPARRDTTRADSARADSARLLGPRPSRPSPSPDVVLRLGAPLRPNTAYRVGARDARSLSGYAGPSSRSVTTPKVDAPRADTTRRAPVRGAPAAPTTPARPPAAPARPPATQPPARPDTARPPAAPPTASR